CGSPMVAGALSNFRARAQVPDPSSPCRRTHLPSVRNRTVLVTPTPRPRMQCMQPIGGRRLRAHDGLIARTRGTFAGRHAPATEDLSMRPIPLVAGLLAAGVFIPTHANAELVMTAPPDV